MSNAPSDSSENCSERSIRPNSSAPTATGLRPASRLMRDSSESLLYGLIRRSMRCISAITASIARSAARASSAHSSTWIAVPMIASSRLNQRPDAGTAAGTGPVARGRSVDRFRRMAKGFARSLPGTAHTEGLRVCKAGASSLSAETQLRQEVGKRRSPYEPTHKKPRPPRIGEPRVTTRSVNARRAASPVCGNVLTVRLAHARVCAA